MSVIFTQAHADNQAAGEYPLTHARVGYQTYTRDLTAAAVTASSEAADAPADAPLRPDTYEYWQPTALPATWQIDLGASQSIDYVGLGGHTFGSNGTTVLIETSPDAATWTTFADDAAPSNDAPLMFLDESRNARYVRITLDAINSPGDEPRLAVVYIGEVLAMQRMIFGGHTPMPLQRETVLRSALSKGGQFLGQNIQRKGVTGDAAFRHLTNDWVRNSLDPFIKAARNYPFFFAWRPYGYSEDVAYCWATGDIAPINMGVKDFLSVQWSMRGIGYSD